MDNAPEAAAPTTEATNTNTNPAPAETTAPAEPAQAPDLHGFTNEQLAEMSKFIESNGGYDKAFKTFKERISNPAPEAPKAQEEPAAQEAQPQAQEQPAHPQTPAGYMSQQEYNVRRFYQDLASQPEYAPIADKITSGEMFKEMAKFGIRPMDQNGNINDAQVREFFNLYAKTVPAAPAKTPAEAAAPTVEYIPVNNGKIENFQQAAQIIAQSAKLKASGQAEHPQLQAAEEFIKNSLTPGKK